MLLLTLFKCILCFRYTSILGINHTNFNQTNIFGKIITLSFPPYSEFTMPAYILRIKLPPIYIDNNQTYELYQY